MTMNIRDQGTGQFTSGWGAGDTVEISINVSSTADTSGIEQMQVAMGDLQGATEVTSTTTMDFSNVNRESTETLQERMAPVRSASWDFMLMGRAMSVLNNTFFGHNEVLKAFTGIIYGAGATMRIFVTAVDLLKIANEFGIGVDTQRIISTQALTASYTELAAAETAAATAGLGAGIAGVTTYAPLVLGGIAALQKGGYITSTGVALVHKGETVVPAGMNYSNINLVLNTGPISSNVDVDNMMDTVALRMAQEARRRGGR